MPFSPLDTSDFKDNSWLTGFTEADGYFGVKVLEPKAKTEKSKRARSGYIGLVFRLDQRSYDKPTNSSFESFMELLGKFLRPPAQPVAPRGARAGDCNLLSFNDGKCLSLSITSLDKINKLIIYFNRFPLLGIKGKDFKDWEKIYYMIQEKEHLTDKGKIIINTYRSNMNSNRKV